MFDADFEIKEAYEVPANQIEQDIRFVPHINGRQPSLSQVRTLGTDVTTEMQATYARIDSTPLPT